MNNKITYVCAVVHDGADVVLDIACRHLVPRILLEVALVAGQDVLEVNGDVVVSVRSGLLVVETDGVADLVSDDSQLKEILDKVEYRFRKLLSGQIKVYTVERIKALQKNF